MRRTPGLSALLALSCLVALTGALAPATAAVPGPPPVVGGSTATYRAEPYRDPVQARSVTGRTLWLTGGPTDDLTGGRLTTSPSTGEGVQRLEPVRNDGAVPDSGAAHWQGDYSGRISGPVRVTLQWQRPVTAEAVGFTGDNVVYQLWADPGTPQQALLATERTRLTMDEPTTTTVVDLQADGRVTSTLLLQVVAGLAEMQGYSVRYGSATAPGTLVVPTVAVPRVPPVTTTALPDRTPLVLGAAELPRPAGEPTVGITPAGTAFVTTVEAVPPDGLFQTVLHASYDGGRSFVPATPRLAGEPFPPRTQDPYVHVDPVTGRVFTVDLLQACSVLHWSDDEGRTWSPANPLSCTGGLDDHQTIVTGPPPPGVVTDGYPRVLYYCANKVYGTQCVRSLDGGETFGPTGELAFEGFSTGDPAGEGSAVQGGFCNGLTGHAVTDLAGRLYLPKGHCGRPWLAVSEDGGATWRRTLVSRVTAADPQTSVAVDSAGNAYYAFFDATAKLPYLAVSRDAGRTFATPLLVSPPGVAAVNFPTVDAGGPGVVALAFPSTSVVDETSLRVPWDHHVVVSADALSPRPTFRSATSNPRSDPVHRGRCLGRCAGMLDFLDVALSPAGDVWATVVDTCTGDCVAADGAASAARGVVVRSLGAASPPAAGGAVPPTGALPATGSGTGPGLALALLLGAAALLVGRRAVPPG